MIYSTSVQEESFNDIKTTNFQDIIPRYLNLEEVKEQRQERMCKYYAHHLICPMEDTKEGCEYLHDVQVRGAHDFMANNKRLKRQQPSVKEVQKMLVFQFNENNHAQREEVLWKQDALFNYPMLPTYADKRRNKGDERRKRMTQSI